MKPSSARKIRLLIADDHLVVRMGLVAVLSFESDLEVVGEASTGDEAISLAKKLKPDVIVMDLMMPNTDGAQATAVIRRNNPRIKILILTSFGSSRELAEALAAGASGALLKTAEKNELIEAIRKVAAGQTTVTRSLTPTEQFGSTSPLLSARQDEILRLVAKGLTNQDIARILGISVDTVKTHLKSINLKLGTASRTEATTTALDAGFLRN